MCTIPGVSGFGVGADPCIVNVFPDDVCPYAKIVPFNPAVTLSTMPLAAAA
jgi:hypothetical protein